MALLPAPPVMDPLAGMGGVMPQQPTIMPNPTPVPNRPDLSALLGGHTPFAQAILQAIAAQRGGGGGFGGGMQPGQPAAMPAPMAPPEASPMMGFFNRLRPPTPPMPVGQMDFRGFGNPGGGGLAARPGMGGMPPRSY